MRHVTTTDAISAIVPYRSKCRAAAEILNALPQTDEILHPAQLVFVMAFIEHLCLEHHADSDSDIQRFVDLVDTWANAMMFDSMRTEYDPIAYSDRADTSLN